jgi:predicted ATPase/class 3 adenylate cyclase
VDEDSLHVLFTDIEGSTQLWDAGPDEMSQAMDAHDSELTRAITDAGGGVLSYNGDGFSACFPNAQAAVVASIDIQSSLVRLCKQIPVTLLVRAAVHSGSPTWRGGEPRGRVMNEASRVMSAGHGGQVLLSGAAAVAVRHDLPAAAALRDLGTYRLKGLADPMRLFQLTHPNLSVQFPPPRAISISDGLVQDRGRLIGREEELRTLDLHVRAGSVTVLVGTAGVGKTRLAIEIARRHSSAFADGAKLIELATVLEPPAVGEVCAAALGVRARLHGGVFPSIVETLRHRNQLIVIDNCEHVLDQVRQFVANVQPACPGIALVLTSRESLATEHEITFRVSPLALTEGTTQRGQESPAVELFLDRAGAVQPRLTLDDAGQGVVAEIARRLDGLPLALELAASQLHRSTLTELHQTVMRGDLLDTVSHAPHYVHGKLERAIGWSYDRLQDHARVVFEACSVFAGQFGVDAAAEVSIPLSASVVRSALDELVRTSLVDDVMLPERQLFRLLDSSRSFAGRRLATNDGLASCRGLLVRHYVAFVSLAASRLQGADEREWVRAIGNEFANIRYAHQIAADQGDTNAAMALTAGLHDWALWRMWYELTEWALGALRMPGAESHPLYADVSATAIYALWAQGDRDKAGRLSEHVVCVEQAKGHKASVLLLDAIASLALYERRMKDAMRWTTEWLELARSRGETFRLARAFYTATLVQMASGNIEKATGLAREAMETALATGSPTALAFAHHAQGLLARRADPGWAARCFETATTLASGVDNELAIGLAQAELARLTERDSPAKALGAMRDVLQRWTTARDFANQMLSIRRIALLLGTIGHEEEAITLVSATRPDASTEELTQRDDVIRPLCGRIGERRFLPSVSLGQLIGPTSVVDYAFDVIARVFLAEGIVATATTYDTGSQ